MRALRVLAWFVVFFGVGCESPMPNWDHKVGASGSADGAADPLAPAVHFDPVAPADAVTRATRITLGFGRPLDSPRVLLVSGTLSPAQLRDLERPVLPATLLARAEPAVIWTTADPPELVVAPLQLLTPGAPYTVAVSHPLLGISFVIAPNDAVARLTRVWPDAMDADSAATTAVWCGARSLAEIDQVVELPPAGTMARLVRGTGSSVAAAECVSVRPLSAEVREGAALPALTPPSIVQDDASLVLLEPALLWPGIKGREVFALSCDAAEVPFARGCADVEDDRILLRVPEGPLLWTIDDGLGAIVRAVRGPKTIVLRPLPPEGNYRVAALDPAGSVTESDITVRPAPVRSHVVLSEVMANPLGIERDQEWVEIYNDGLSAISIDGYALETAGGTVLLPSAKLGSGAYALIVPSGFVEDDGADPVVHAGTTILRVPSLGRDGLSNEGERLTLRDASNAVLSTFPAMKSKSGVSNVRVSPDAPDANADSFAPSANGRASPGAPNASAARTPPQLR